MREPSLSGHFGREKVANTRELSLVHYLGGHYGRKGDEGSVIIPLFIMLFIEIICYDLLYCCCDRIILKPHYRKEYIALAFECRIPWIASQYLVDIRLNYEHITFFVYTY